MFNYMYNGMYNKIYKILIIAIPIIIIYFLISREGNVNNDMNDTQNYYIHSSELKKSFLVKDLNDNKISEIQLSLNKRDKLYKIKRVNNSYKLLYKDIQKDLINIC